MKYQLICALVLGYQSVCGHVEKRYLFEGNQQTGSSPTTTEYRKMASWPEDLSEEATTEDPLDPNTNTFRRNFAEIWDWDYWCQLQPKKGNCTKHVQKYFYDTQLDQCLTFAFTGCNGNKNNFFSKQDCERHCKGAAYLNTPTNRDGRYHCGFQPNAGLCLAMMRKYYYDLNEDNCRSFTYGGCGGNANRFDSIDKCFDSCHSSRRSFPYKSPDLPIHHIY